ncbi:putative nucleic acid-binding protein [Silvibacterium bohemicum]|uniref:Putative nucleic acid-binding protein n=1 Tax=Silvibacterium bohemicum TaxID=1577686 RepID=A0A841K9V0_9BACT|nr:putative nucleic acid-binding protein [Silvibacterium bohemicum]
MALGSLRQREIVLGALGNLPQATMATDDEVLRAIDRWKLFASGLGYIDAHLLASAALTPGTALWTRDKRLHVVAVRLGFDAGLN